jgi:hypothetical protein
MGTDFKKIEEDLDKFELLKKDMQSGAVINHLVKIFSESSYPWMRFFKNPSYRDSYGDRFENLIDFVLKHSSMGFFGGEPLASLYRAVGIKHSELLLGKKPLATNILFIEGIRKKVHDQCEEAISIHSNSASGLDTCEKYIRFIAGYQMAIAPDKAKSTFLGLLEKASDAEILDAQDILTSPYLNKDTVDILRSQILLFRKEQKKKKATP